MRKSLYAATLAFTVLALLLWRSPGNRQRPAVLAAENPMPAACIPPSHVGSSPEQTAWQLFVASTCPVNANQYPYVVWENWIEQGQLYGAGAAQALAAGGRPRFHMSPLAKFMREKAKGVPHPEAVLPTGANEDCNSQTWSGRTICEEARLNPSAQDYVTSNSLTTLDGQVAFITAGKAFDFTPPSVELKADWIQYPLATCTNPPAGVHVETVAGSCYALGGIHLISKLIDKWIWATFEPQNSLTNPQRCVVLGCNDPWGSVPARSSGKPTKQSQVLAQLMKDANLAAEWRNYRLDGVQVDFVDAAGKATVLGNSVIEGDNAGNPTLMKSSSCITCHDLSTINKSKQELSPDFIIGPPKSIPAGYVRRDFVWSLSLAQ